MVALLGSEGWMFMCLQVQCGEGMQTAALHGGEVNILCPLAWLHGGHGAMTSPSMPCHSKTMDGCQIKLQHD